MTYRVISANSYSRTLFEHASLQAPVCGVPRPAKRSAHICSSFSLDSISKHAQVARNQPLLAATASAGAAAAGPGPGTVQTAEAAVTRFYGALNLRDAAALSSSLAGDVLYENLALTDSLQGKNAVAQFYQESLASVPDEASFVLEQVTGNATKASVVWRLLLSSSQTLMSRGISFYTLDPQGLISSVVECYEHPVKISQAQLPLVRPLVRNLSGPMLPAVQEVSRALQQGVDSLLDPINSLSNLVAAQQQQQQQQPSSSSGFPFSTPPQAVQGGWTSQPPPNSSNSSSSSRAAPAAATRTAVTGATPAAAAAPKRSPSPAAVGRAPAPPNQAARPGAAVATAAAASGGYGAAAAAADAGQPVDLSGLWVKDAARSDTKGYESSLDVLGLSGLQKVTARLIEGIEIQQAPSKFTVSFVTVVPFFRVTEAVPLDGGSSQLGRRDLRPGRQAATGKSVPGGVLVEMSWGEPMAGSLSELYTLLPDGCLCVHAETRVGQKVAVADAIYSRSSGSRDALLSDSRRRNGSVADVLRRQREQGLSM